MGEILDISITEGKVWFEINNNSNANIFSISNIMLIMVEFYSIATTYHILKKETYISIFFTLKGEKSLRGGCQLMCVQVNPESGTGTTEKRRSTDRNQ